MTPSGVLPQDRAFNLLGGPLDRGPGFESLADMNCPSISPPLAPLNTVTSMAPSTAPLLDNADNGLCTDRCPVAIRVADGPFR